MRKLLTIAALTASMLIVAGSSAGSAEGDAGTLQQPRPTWLTTELEHDIAAAGPRGVEVRLA
jgi:hypothetical protein